MIDFNAYKRFMELSRKMAMGEPVDLNELKKLRILRLNWERDLILCIIFGIFTIVMLYLELRGILHGPGILLTIIGIVLTLIFGLISATKTGIENMTRIIILSINETINNAVYIITKAIKEGNQEVIKVIKEGNQEVIKVIKEGNQEVIKGIKEPVEYNFKVLSDILGDIRSKL